MLPRLRTGALYNQQLSALAIAQQAPTPASANQAPAAAYAVVNEILLDEHQLSAWRLVLRVNSMPKRSFWTRMRQYSQNALADLDDGGGAAQVPPLAPAAAAAGAAAAASDDDGDGSGDGGSDGSGSDGSGSDGSGDDDGDGESRGSS